MLTVNRVVAVLSLLFSTFAHAIPSPDAPAQSTGSFTVTYQASFYPGFRVQLEEKSPSGYWQIVDDPNHTGSVSFSRGPGVYEFRTHQILTEYEFRPPEEFHFYSQPTIVTVTDIDVPPLDIFEDQLRYEYTVRSGDVDNNGTIDVFLERSSGDLDNGVIAEAMLKALPAGGYALYYPTATQLDAARYWLELDATVTLGDFNFDEVVDVVLSGLPNSGFPQILVSSGEYFGREAVSHTEADEDLQNFYGDVAGWLGDGTYFANAGMPDKPGYNIRIDYLITLCYTWYGFPICSSTSIKLVDFDISLEDLGLDNFLAVSGTLAPGMHGKVSPGGVTAEAVGNYISADVHAVAATQLATDNITSLHGTSEEGAYALSALEPYLTPVSDPQILRCVVFCGYDFAFGYDSFVVIAWVDTWTPIVIPGEFDENNYSKAAFDATQLIGDIFVGGETAVSAEDWYDFISIVTVQAAVPLPSPSPGPPPELPELPGPEQGPANDPDANERRRKLRFGLLGRLIWGLAAIEAAEEVNVRIRRNKNTYHYTDAFGVGAIAASGEVINPRDPIGGDTFWTQSAYPTNKIATELLALCGEPRVGFYVVNLLQTGAGPLSEVAPKLCDDGSHPQGGGSEQIAPSPVNAQPLRFVPILPDFEEDFVWD